jgi:hypothetical protein
VLTGSTGDLIFAINSTQTTITKGWDTWIILIPPGFVVPDTSQVVSTLTNTYDNVFTTTLSPYDRYAPGWTMVSIRVDGAINPSYNHQYIDFTTAKEWYYARINGVTAPSVAGKYFFKMLLYGDSGYLAPNSLTSTGGTSPPAITSGGGEMPTQFVAPENWPVLLVKGEIDPAIITGTIRYGGYNASLYGQPVQEAGRVYAKMTTRLDPYTGQNRPDLPLVDAVGYFNATATGHYEVEGLAPGTYDLYASTAGYPQALIASGVTVLKGQSLHFDGYLQPGPVIHGNVFTKHQFGDQPWPENTYVKIELYDAPTLNHIPASNATLVSWSPLPCVAGGQNLFFGSQNAGSCGDPRLGSSIAFPWHEYTTANSYETDETGVSFGANDGSAVGLLTTDPEGVGPPMTWFVKGATTTPFHFEFGVKGEYGAPRDLDGMVPQVYATWVNGLVPGRYYVRAWVFRYVQTALDGSTFQEYYFDVTPNEWAGDVTLPIDLRLSSWINKTVHYHITNGTIVDEPIDTGAGFLYGYLTNSNGVIYSYNVTALGFKGKYAYGGAGGYPLTTPFFSGNDLDPAGINAHAIENGRAAIQFWGVNDTWGGENYGIPTGTYTASVETEGYLEGTPLDQVSVTLSGSPTSISDHMYRGAGFNITIYSIDWEQPLVSRPWVWGNDQGGANGNGVNRGSEIDIGFFSNGLLTNVLGDLTGDLPVTITTTGLYQGVGSHACANEAALPVLSRTCTLMDGGGRNVRPDGSDNANLVFFGREAGDTWVGGSTGGTFVFLTQSNLRSSIYWPEPSAFPSGTYDLRAFTYGYFQDKNFTVNAQAGQVADIRINLIVGVNVTLDILFKKEQIITGTQADMSARVRLFDDQGDLAATWMSSEGVYVTGEGVSHAADATTAYPLIDQGVLTVPGSGLQSYNFLPGGTTLLHVLMAGLPQQPPHGSGITGNYFGDPVFTPYACDFELYCYRGTYGRWAPIGQTVYPFANTGILGAPDYQGGWTAEVDFVNWYANDTGTTPNYYPPVQGLLMGESYHIIPGTAATSGVSWTEDTALRYLGHGMAANHLGPYSQRGVWQISGAHNSGEASAIFEVDLNGFISGNVLAFTWSNEFRTLSWGTVSVTGASYQANHVAKTVSSANGASIDTNESPPFGTGAGKFVAANSQYLSIPNSTDFNFGSNDFTIDFWIKFNSLSSSYPILIGQNDATHTGNDLVMHVVSGSTYSLYWQDQTLGQVVSGTTTIVTGTWYHMAVVRNGNTWAIYVNGSSIATANNSGSTTSLSIPFIVGANLYSNIYVDGWFKEVRVSNGVARWTSNFPSPDAEYTPDQYTVLLLHMDGTNGSTMFTDSNSGPVNVQPAEPFGNFYTYDGVYQVFMPPGNYKFTISQPGYAPQTWSVSVSPGESGAGQNVYLEQSNIPVPEFSSIAVIAFAALAASLYLLKRRRK